MWIGSRLRAALRAPGQLRPARALGLAALAALWAGAAGAQGTSTARSPTVTFSAPGVVSVTLRSCNAVGCGEVTRQVTVLDPRPAIVSMTVPPEAFAGEEVVLSAATTGQPSLSHRWTVSGPLGDEVLLGNPARWAAPTGESTYQVRLDLTNAHGAAAAGPAPLVVVAPTFADVPRTYWSWRFVEAVHRRGVRAACAESPARYCPEEVITRGSMALFLLGAKEGAGYQPAACVTPVFADVPCSHPLAPWINELARRGVTAGCGGGDYCPDAPVSRAQMAVFLLATLNGPGWSPWACISRPFVDVPCTTPFAPWIRDLVVLGITAGCGAGAYCPTHAVTRGQMAVFVAMTFGLPLP